MNLKSYLNFYALLQVDKSRQEDNRAFGLEYSKLKHAPTKQLVVWTKRQTPSLKKPLLSEMFLSHLYNITLLLATVALLLGFFSGVGLLSYSGHEPVNVIYFIAMVVLFPLATMGLSLFSMFRANNSQSLLVHISPAFWMEKIVNFLPYKIQSSLQEVKINPLLANWLIIKRSQLLALMFSLGLLMALLGMVVTKDIAFAWSTTLQVSPKEFHTMLHTLAFAWRDLFPWAVPSIELIEQSQYFRLGEKLDREMIYNASKLGEWWKFLAFATIFYAIILRFVVYLLSKFGLRRAVKKSFLTLSGAKSLLMEMNEPIISTHAHQSEVEFMQKDMNYEQVLNSLDSSYDMIQGWAISKDKLVVISDSLQIISPKLFEVGGGNSLEEDNEIVTMSHGEVLLFTKGWEPPTMDFIDFLETLVRYADKVIICPIGTVENSYTLEAKQVTVWARKLFTFNSEKVWLKISKAKALSREAPNAES